MVADAELAFDQSRDARARPQLGAIAVRLGALEKKSPKRLALFVAQLRRSTGRRTRAKAGLAATAIVRLPPSDAAWVHLESARHVRRAAPGLNHGDGPHPTLLEMFGRAVRSHANRHRPEGPIGRNFYRTQERVTRPDSVGIPPAHPSQASSLKPSAYPQLPSRISRSFTPTVQSSSKSAGQSSQSAHGPHEPSRMSRSFTPTVPSPSISPSV